MLLLEKKSIEQYLVRYHEATMSKRKKGVDNMGKKAVSE